MGKHYKTEFKLQTLQPILNGKMSIREAARFYNRHHFIATPNHFIISLSSQPLRLA